MPCLCGIPARRSVEVRDSSFLLWQLYLVQSGKDAFCLHFHITVDLARASASYRVLLFPRVDNNSSRVNKNYTEFYLILGVALSDEVLQ